MPSTGNFVAGCVTLFFGIAVASAGGVGGGGICLPILLIIFGYGFDTSVSLSLCIVFGNSLSQSFINLQTRHPSSSVSPLIFWELVLVLLPAQMGGSNIGTVLSNILPLSILYLLAFIVLLAASTLSLQKGLHKYHDESERVKKKISEMRIEETTSNPLGNGDEVSHSGNITHSSNSELSKAELPPIQWPYNILIILATMWCCYVGLAIGLTLSSQCSTTYAVLFVMLYVPIGTVVIYGTWRGFNEQKSAAKQDIERAETQPRVTSIELSIYSDSKTNNGELPIGKPRNINDFDFRRVSWQLPSITFCIGIICSLLGIGGAELLGPLLLQFGLLPQVISATTSFLSLCTSFSTLIQHAVDGKVDFDAGWILFLVGLTAGVVGRKLGFFFAEKYDRPSIIIFCLVVALYLTCIYYLYKLASSSFDTSVKSFC